MYVSDVLNDYRQSFWPELNFIVFWSSSVSTIMPAFRDAPYLCRLCKDPVDEKLRASYFTDCRECRNILSSIRNFASKGEWTKAFIRQITRNLEVIGDATGSSTAGHPTDMCSDRRPCAAFGTMCDLCGFPIQSAKVEDLRPLATSLHGVRHR